jgi:hypothetical protein
MERETGTQGCCDIYQLLEVDHLYQENISSV